MSYCYRHVVDNRQIDNVAKQLWGIYSSENPSIWFAWIEYKMRRPIRICCIKNSLIYTCCYANANIRYGKESIEIIKGNPMKEPSAPPDVVNITWVYYRIVFSHRQLLILSAESNSALTTWTDRRIDFRWATPKYPENGYTENNEAKVTILVLANSLIEDPHDSWNSTYLKRASS